MSEVWLAEFGKTVKNRDDEGIFTKRRQMYHDWMRHQRSYSNRHGIHSKDWLSSKHLKWRIDAMINARDYMFTGDYMLYGFY